MNIYYQGLEGAYGHIVSKHFSESIGIDDVIGLDTFKKVFEKIEEGNLGVVPIENSYAGSIYENFFNLSNYDVQIYSEYYLDINHCLASTSKSIDSIEKVFSHYQALMQCENYINSYGWEARGYMDTAGSAKYVSEQNDDSLACICSNLAAERFGLNILAKNIQDQDNNSTRFFLVGRPDINLELQLKGKMSLVFKARHIPASLYKCLGAFATRNINLTKIESLPAKDDGFDYMFWIDIELDRNQDVVSNALEELGFFTKKIKIIGNY
ncbi:prephenate dehydratase [Candidatus Absconditicoccus praedator]|uniref:prephenate dehydratase n=1 Tax=Candidatus Absconditicoccus praedator TaxID=2735562 RepID=UPI001E53AE4C|nr:prephenate dehydratase domain-containing protein [Candidatus Absconditicoccus praedator]UFX82996.1 hypothetical protein HLG78_02575 [Candidatus Absconditicoccus praedator]